MTTSAARRTLPVLSDRPAASSGGDAAADRSSAAAPADGPLIDGFARRVSYLRVSLTDRCNYRCTYCMPEGGVDLVPREEVLSFEEIADVVSALCRVGVRRVRLTGGEPTVRKDLVHLVERLAGLPLLDLSLSTNGERLSELAAPLRRAGLHRLNVSLDTLDPARFREVTRRGHLPAVLAGLEAAREAGFTHTKLNTVAMEGWNDGELADICAYAWSRGFVPRFIELMPMAEGQLFYPGRFLPAARIRARLEGAFGPAAPEDSDLPGVGPARYLRFRDEGPAGQVRRAGVISAVTEPFCDTCNRVRLSATGQLHGCLGRDESADLRTPLRGARAAGRSGEALAAELLATVRGALQAKARGHEFTLAGCGGPKKFMVSIGG